MSQSRLVSTKSEMSWLVSCLDTSVLANDSVSEKNVSTPSLLISQRLILFNHVTLTFDPEVGILPGLICC